MNTTENVECSTCKGTGRVRVRLLGDVVGRCPICRGVGQVEADPTPENVETSDE